MLNSVEERLAEIWLEVLPTDFANMSTTGSNTDLFVVESNSILLVKLAGSHPRRLQHASPAYPTPSCEYPVRTGLPRGSLQVVDTVY